MSGQRANAEAIFELNNTNLAKMDVKPSQIAALCTDNPTVMIAVHKAWEKDHPQCIVSQPDTSTILYSAYIC